MRSRDMTVEGSSPHNREETGRVQSKADVETTPQTFIGRRAIGGL